MTDRTASAANTSPAGEVRMTCSRCHFWMPYTHMMSHDGKEFTIGHCGNSRGLTADDYQCLEFVDSETIVVPIPMRDDVGPRPASEEA